MIHKHHIVPKYEGGSDYAENIVELTVTQHAMWHFAEWCRKGNWQDQCAWQSLSGLIGKEEAHRMASSAGGLAGRGTKRSPNGGKVGGKVGGKIGGRKNVESGHLASISSKGGKKGGTIACAIKYQCLVTGHISNAGGLSCYQKARGINSKLRKRLLR
jgi:hypothetical protein